MELALAAESVVLAVMAAETFWVVAPLCFEGQGFDYQRSLLGSFQGRVVSLWYCGWKAQILCGYRVRTDELSDERLTVLSQRLPH